MADTNIQNKLDSLQQQGPEQVLDTYSSESLLQRVADWQKAYQGDHELATNNIIVFPDEGTLHAMVREDLLAHLTSRSSDPFRGEELTEEECSRLLEEHRISIEEFTIRIAEVAETLQQQFGVDVLSAHEAEAGVLHYELGNVPLAVPVAPIEEEVSSVFVLDKYGPDRSQVIALIDEGQDLLSQSAQPPPLPIDPNLPVVAGISDLEHLGSGGMGQVYRCTIEGAPGEEPREGVVKVVQSHLRNQQELRSRLEREAQLLEESAASSEYASHFPQVLGKGVDENGVPYFVQELIPGVNLEFDLSLVKWHRSCSRTDDPEMRRDELQALQKEGQAMLAVFPGMLRALGDMHERGIVHRDLKPANIVVVRDPDTNKPERLVVLDFGLAKRVHDPPSGSTHAAYSSSVAGSVDGELTSPHAAVGTPMYMSPEQHRNKNVTEKADVFAAGLTLYRSVTGGDALFGELEGVLLNNGQVQEAVMHRQFSSIQREKEQLDPASRLHPQLYTIIKGMLEKNPDKRPTMKEAADQIEQHLREPSMTLMERVQYSWDMASSPISFAVSMLRGFPVKDSPQGRT